MNALLFEHRQYFIDVRAGLDQRPSIPVEDEVAALIFAKAKKDGFVVRIENGDHALTIVHRRWDTCAGKAFRTQLVAKRSQDRNVGRGKALAVECDDRHWSGGFPGSNDSGCAVLTDQGNEAVNRSATHRG